MEMDFNVSAEALYNSEQNVVKFINYINELHPKITQLEKNKIAFADDSNCVAMISNCVTRFSNILEQSKNIKDKFTNLKTKLFEMNPDFNLYYVYMTLYESGEIDIGSYDEFMNMSEDEKQLYILKYYEEYYNNLIDIYQNEINTLTILFRDFENPKLSGYNIEGLCSKFHSYGGGDGYYYYLSPTLMNQGSGYDWWYKNIILKEKCRQAGYTEEEYLNMVQDCFVSGDYWDEYYSWVANVYTPMYNGYLYEYCRDYYESQGRLEEFDPLYKRDTFSTDIITDLKNNQTYVKDVTLYDTREAIKEYQFAVEHPLSDNPPPRETHGVEEYDFNGKDYEGASSTILSQIGLFCTSDACKYSEIIDQYRTSTGGWAYRTPPQYKAYYNNLLTNPNGWPEDYLKQTIESKPTPEEYEAEFYKIFHEYSDSLYYFRLDDDGNVVDISYNEEQHAEDLEGKSKYDNLYYIEIDGLWLTEGQYDKWYQYKAEYGIETADEYLNSIKDTLNKQTAEVNAGKEIEAATRSDGTIDWTKVSVDGFEDGVINWAEGISNAFNADGTKTLGNYEQMYYMQYLTNSAGIYLQEIVDEYCATHSEKEIEEFKNNIYNSDGNINFGFLSGKIDSSKYQTLVTKVNNDKNGWNTFCYEMSSTAGNMAPTMALSIAFSCVPLPGAALAGSLLGQGAMGLSAYGNAKNEALIAGHDKATANFYALLSATSEVGLSLILGNIPGLNVDAALSLRGILQEGAEEFIQEYVSAGLNATILGETINFDELNEQALKSFIYGSILSAGTNTAMAGLESVLPSYNFTMNGQSVNFSNTTSLVKLLEMFINKDISYGNLMEGIKGFKVPSGASSYLEIVQEVFPGATVCEVDSDGNIVSMTVNGQKISSDSASINRDLTNVGSQLDKLGPIESVEVPTVNPVETTTPGFDGNIGDVASNPAVGAVTDINGDVNQGSAKGQEGGFTFSHSPDLLGDRHSTSPTENVNKYPSNIDSILDNFLGLDEYTLTSEQMTQFYEQVERYKQLSQIPPVINSPRVNADGKVVFEEGTLIHGIGKYNPEVVENISNIGILSGQAFGIFEDGETYFCADFFRVASECEVSDFKTEVPDANGIKASSDRFTPFPGRASSSKSIAFIVSPNESNANLLSYDCYRHGTESSDITKSFVVQEALPFSGNETDRASSILFGVPSNAISGIVVGSEVINNADAMNQLKSAFPNCYIVDTEGNLIYNPADSSVSVSDTNMDADTASSSVGDKKFGSDDDIKTKGFDYQSMFGGSVSIQDIVEAKTLQSFAQLTDNELNNLLDSQNSSYVEQKAAALTLYLKSIGLNFNNNDIKSIYNCLLCKLYNTEISIVEKNMIYELLGTVSSLSNEFKTLDKIMSYDFPTRDSVYIAKIQKRHNKFNLGNFYSLRDGSAATIVMTEQQVVSLETGSHDAGFNDMLNAIYNIQRGSMRIKGDISNDLLNSMSDQSKSDCICVRLIADDYPFFAINFPDRISTKQYQMFEAFVHENASKLSEISKSFYGEDGGLIYYGDDQVTSDLTDALEYAKTLIDDSVKLPDDKNIIGDTIADLGLDNDSAWVEDEDFGIEEDEYELKDGESLRDKIGIQFFGGKDNGGGIDTISLSPINPNNVFSDMVSKMGDNATRKALWHYVNNGDLSYIPVEFQSLVQGISTDAINNFLESYRNNNVIPDNDIIQYNISDLQGAIDSVDSIYGKNFALKQLYDYIVSGQNPSVLPVTGNFRTIVTNLDYNTLVECYNTIVNSQSEVKTIKDEIFENMPDGLDYFSKARYLYLELNKRINYDTAFMFGDEETKNSIYNQDVTFDTLKGNKVVCKGWSELFRELLIDSGFSSDDVRVVGSYHKWVEIDCGDVIIRADATDNFKGTNDLAASKGRLATVGFLCLDKIYSGYNLNQKVQIKNDDGSTSVVKVYDTIDSDVIEDNVRWLSNIDNYIGYSNDGKYFNDTLATAKDYFYSPTIVEKIFGVKPEKVYEAKVEKFINMELPANMDALDACNYFRQVNKVVFGTNSQIGVTPYKRFLSDGTQVLATVITVPGVDASSPKICKIIDDDLGITINSFDNLMQVRNYLESIGYVPLK